MLAVSEADPYVVLQMPTAPGTKFKTKTVTNSSHPVWNETFTFLIQGQVKVKVRVSLATHLRTGCTTYTNILGWSTPFCGAQAETLGNGVSVRSSLDVLYARGYVNGRVMVLPKPVCGVEA